MNYLLDTNICIHFFRGKFGVTERLELAKAEKSANPAKNNHLIEHLIDIVSIIPIFDSIKLYGKEKARLRKAGTMISDLDLFIGYTAVEKNLIMVTENTSEFDRISDINLENWVDRSL